MLTSSTPQSRSKQYGDSSATNGVAFEELAKSHQEIYEKFKLNYNPTKESLPTSIGTMPQKEI